MQKRRKQRHNWEWLPRRKLSHRNWSGHVSSQTAPYMKLTMSFQQPSPSLRLLRKILWAFSVTLLQVNMAKKRVMVAVESIDISAVKYEQEEIKGQWLSPKLNDQHSTLIVTWNLTRLNWVFFSVFVAPHLTGFFLKLFVWIVEAPMIGSVIISFLKKQNKMTQVCCCAFSVFLSLCYI